MIFTTLPLAPKMKELPALEKTEESMHLKHRTHSGSCGKTQSHEYELNNYKAAENVFHLNRNL